MLLQFPQRWRINIDFPTSLYGLYCTREGRPGVFEWRIGCLSFCIRREKTSAACESGVSMT